MIELAWALLTFESLQALQQERHCWHRTAEVRGSNPLGSANVSKHLTPQAIGPQIAPEAYRKQADQVRRVAEIDPAPDAQFNVSLADT